MRAAFTIVLNGIKHLENWAEENATNFDLWVIVEGAVDPVSCTSWCKPIPEQYVVNGGSVDGTREFIDDLADQHNNVVVISKDELWKGKIEMVRAAIDAIKARNIPYDYLWQIDVDEYWSLEQLEEAEYDLQKAGGTSLTFLTDCILYANNEYALIVQGDWGEGYDMNFRRLWKYHSGLKFMSHEPPRIEGDVRNIFTNKPRPLHLSYFYPEDISFKSEFYKDHEGCLKGHEMVRSLMAKSNFDQMYTAALFANQGKAKYLPKTDMIKKVPIYQLSIETQIKLKMIQDA